MKFRIVSVFPALFESYLNTGVLSQALKKNLFQFEVVNPRDFTQDNYKSVDDRPFGGGDGMVLLPEVLEACMKEDSSTHVVYLSPQGQTLSEKKVQELSKNDSITFICGRYGGIDQRFLNEFVDEELSIGDYVISGGELAALTVMDAVIRKIPGALGHHESANEDSFSKSGLLEHPLFTRPQDWKGEKVPEVLLSGNHGKIKIWKDQMSALITFKKRPDLLPKNFDLKELKKFYDGLSQDEKKVCGVEGLDERF